MNDHAKILPEDTFYRHRNSDGSVGGLIAKDVTPGTGLWLHASSVISQGCCVRDNVRIFESVLVQSGATLGEGVVLLERVVVCDNVWVGHGCVIGEGVRVGSGSRIQPQVRIQPRVLVGNGSVIARGCIVPADVTLGHYARFPVVIAPKEAK